MPVACDPIQINLSETNPRTTTMYDTFAKILIALGVFLILIGVIVFALGEAGVLEKLPGDMHIEKKNFEFHFPVVTCIITGIILSLLLSAVFLWSKK
ncbi:MAG: DUF2905 domain-containing protein [Candidatus Zixiibacteriota bacterium]